MAIVSKSIVPDISLIDPMLTVTMRAELTAETGLDALTHAIEAYVSNASSPITDSNAVQAVKHIIQSLPDTAIPLALIASEVLFNICSHDEISGHALLTISLHPLVQFGENGRFSLTISYERSPGKTVLHDSGTDYELTLIKALTYQISGLHSFVHSDSGSIFTLDFGIGG